MSEAGRDGRRDGEWEWDGTNGEEDLLEIQEVDD